MDKSIIINLVAMLITAIGTVGGLGGLMYSILKSFKDDINKHIDGLDNKLTDQGKRIDHLYQICIDMLKERN